MSDKQQPAQNRNAPSDRGTSTFRQREKYPVIPLPQQTRTGRPEIDLMHPGGGAARRFLMAMLWALALLMAAGATLRVFLHDRWIPLVWWNTFTLYVYVPAYACLLVALGMRRWRLVTLSVVLVGCHLVWTVPDFLRRELNAPLESANPSAPGNPGERRLRVYYQNVNGNTTDFSRRFDEMLAEQPDIIALVEFNAAWEQAAIQGNVFQDYPFNTLRERPARSQQMVVFSKLPLQDVEHRYVNGRRLAVAATIRLDSQPFRFFCLHSPRPLFHQAEQYRAYAREVIDWIRRTDGPRVVVGDLNATQHAAWYKRLALVAALHSGHRDVGRGYAVTWPNGRQWIPPIRIDHILLSEHFVAREVREGDGGSSDHKPLLAELELMGGD